MKPGSFSVPVRLRSCGEPSHPLMIPWSSQAVQLHSIRPSTSWRQTVMCPGHRRLPDGDGTAKRFPRGQPPLDSSPPARSNRDVRSSCAPAPERRRAGLRSHANPTRTWRRQTIGRSSTLKPHHGPKGSADWSHRQDAVRTAHFAIGRHRGPHVRSVFSSTDHPSGVTVVAAQGPPVRPSIPRTQSRAEPLRNWERGHSPIPGSGPPRSFPRRSIAGNISSSMNRVRGGMIRDG